MSGAAPYRRSSTTGCTPGATKHVPVYFRTAKQLTQAANTTHCMHGISCHQSHQPSPNVGGGGGSCSCLAAASPGLPPAPAAAASPPAPVPEPPPGPLLAYSTAGRKKSRRAEQRATRQGQPLHTVHLMAIWLPTLWQSWHSTTQRPDSAHSRGLASSAGTQTLPHLARQA